jgi:predicted translin family RNA/ssDNA-binding protein
MIRDEGDVELAKMTPDDPVGNEKRDAERRIRRLLRNTDKARDRYLRLLTEFGLTRSSRSRIKAPTEKPRDELDEHDREFKTA